MKLSEICIERPVLATVISLLITMLGAIALFRLPNRELPDVDPPIVSVITVYPGAAPEVVETSVTEPLEDQLIGIEGVKHLTSLSREQVSGIIVEFELSRDVDLAAADVRDRVARARNQLPDDVDEPIVAKQDADANPILWLALSGGSDQMAVSRLAEDTVQDRLAKLPGVASVVIAGERRMSMRVWIDNDRITAFNLTVDDVAAALRRENVDIPSGRIEGPDREFSVRTLGELDTARSFEELVVANVKGQSVRLRDIGRVEVGPETDRKLVRFNGEAAVGMGVVKLSRANTIAVADAVLAEIEAIRSELPSDVKLTVAFDGSTFIRDSISNVLHSLAESIVLVLIVIFLFLRTFRATLIPAVAIPVSIIGTFSILYFAGFTINTLTLMGLTLAIGLVVDDAIIVLENITRWVEGGTPPREAAIRGMREISFAVVASTVSVVAVFLPLAYLTDTTGRLFGEFGVTVAASVAISGFVALTLSPALCARVLRRGGRETGRARRAGARFGWAHQRLCRSAPSRDGASRRDGRGRRRVVRAGSRDALRGRRRPRVHPHCRSRRLLRLHAGAGGRDDRVHRPLPAPGRADRAGGAGNRSHLLGDCARHRRPGSRQRGHRARLAEERANASRARRDRRPAPEAGRRHRRAGVCERVPRARPRLRRHTGLGGADGAGGGAARGLRRRSWCGAPSRRSPDSLNVRSDLLLNKPQLDVTIDRDRASDLGVSVREIASTLQILLGGSDLSTFKVGGQTYDVIVQLERTERARPGDIPAALRARDGRWPRPALLRGAGRRDRRRARCPALRPPAGRDRDGGPRDGHLAGRGARAHARARRRDPAARGRLTASDSRASRSSTSSRARRSSSPTCSAWS